ncbi:MAG: hypothetical protein HRU33_13710 [Rhodobacteraceae bacterium]|nr:hypothetical protein [Paracoccaceae bacterium]
MTQARKRSNIVPISVDPRSRNALKYRGKEHCDLVKSMARQGEFPEQWCASMDVALSTMYNWATRYPDFDVACRVALTALSAYWTNELRKAARGGSCDRKLFLELLRRRFPDTWGEAARNTEAHFVSSVNAARSTALGGKEITEMTADELRQELKILRMRNDPSVSD